MLTIDEHSAGQRLDNFLARQLKGVPRTRLYRALRKGEVRVNKGRARADYRLAAGDLVRIPPLYSPSPVAAAPAPASALETLARNIIYENDDLLAVNKPSGLAVHGGSGISFGLIEALRQLRPPSAYLELVHRLDRDTSGLVLVAKRAPALRELHRQLRGKDVDKRYMALAAGKWPAATRVVEVPLQKNVLQSGERMVHASGEGKPALTRFRVLERLGGATLLEARPVTGRTHQIRVHARHVGHPLLGDEKYGTAQAAELARQLGLKRLFLHAASLRFTLPETGEIELHAPLEQALETVLQKCRDAV
jgi:23S rRNA pseudouridine955/2504/2580 synthase